MAQARPPAIDFLREDRNVEDEFGAHADIARALVDAIDANPQLRVVGLLGPWGSGKSTVLGLADPLAKARGLRVFTYDAWLHQSDAPRRAFLEELLRHARRAGAALKEIDADWDVLVGRLERVETQVTPRVPLIAGLLIALGLAAPLGLQVVKPEWRYWSKLGSVEWMGETWGWLYAGGVILALLPLVAILLATLGGLLAWVFGGRPEGGPVVAFFASKVRERRTEVKTREPNPTVLEFQRFLRRTLKALEAKTGQRLVVVVDNLDRLPDDEMIGLWSTIRGVFHGRPADDEPDVAIPTVILPVDAAALARLHEDATVAEGFAQKTFDISFRVPTPVASAWKRYLGRRLHEVFGRAVPAKDIDHWAIQAARILEDASTASRTPRSLNAFVNAVAVLWLQWRTRPLSFAAMAFYVTHAARLETLAAPLLLEPRAWMADFDDDWARSVAAIRYGTDREVAWQILLEPELRDAFLRGQSARLARLTEVEGFGAVLRALCDAFAAAPPAHLSQIVGMVDELEDGADPDRTHAWESLAAAAVRQTEWVPRDVVSRQALESLLRRTSARSVAALVAAIPDRFTALGEVPFRDNLHEITRAVAALAAHAGGRHLAVTVPGAADATLELCGALVSQPALLDHFLTPMTPVHLAQELAARLADGSTVGPGLRSLFATTKASSWSQVIHWPSVVDTLVERLVSAEPETGLRIVLLLSELRRLEIGPRAEVDEAVGGPAFRDLVARGLGGPKVRGDGPLRLGAAQALALMLMAGSDLPDTALWSAAEPSVEADDDEEEGGGIDDLGEATAAAIRRMWPDAPAARFVRPGGMLVGESDLRATVVAAQIAGDPAALDPADVARRGRAYAELSSAFAKRARITGDPAQSDAHWRLAARNSTFWDALETDASLDDAVMALGAILRTENIPKTTRNRATLALRRRLAESQFGPKTWRDAVFEGRHPIALLTALEPSNGRAGVTGWLLEALIDVAAQLLTVNDRDIVDRWLSAASRMPAVAQRRAYASVAEAMLAAGNSSGVNLMRQIETPFLTAGPFEADPDAFVRQVFLPAARGQHGAMWLDRQLDVIRPWLAAISTSTRSTARGVLAGILVRSDVVAPHRGAITRLLGAVDPRKGPIDA